MLKRTLVLVLVFLSNAAIAANETTIRILLAKTGGASTQAINSMSSYLLNNWPGSSGVTVQTIGPVVLTNSTLTGSSSSQIAAAKALPNWQSIRDQNNADLVLVFTGSMSDACGRAYQYNWAAFEDGTPGQFIPVNGLDLRGANDSFYAIISTASNCGSHVAAHELGHLLGGGHTLLSGANLYLYSDSHAYATYLFLFGEVQCRASIIAEPNPPSCNGVPISLQDQYSGSGSTNNKRAFSTTALSVANYRVASNSCNLAKPNAVVGSGVAVCAPSPWTKHLISWNDSCPPESDYFRFWSSQPVGSGYVLTNGTTADTSDFFWVVGETARVKVEACGNGSCSGLSNTYYDAHAIPCDPGGGL